MYHLILLLVHVLCLYNFIFTTIISEVDLKSLSGRCSIFLPLFYSNLIYIFIITYREFCNSDTKFPKSYYLIDIQVSGKKPIPTIYIFMFAFHQIDYIHTTYQPIFLLHFVNLFLLPNME